MAKEELTIEKKELKKDKWVIKKIKDFAYTRSGGTPRRSEKAYWNGEIPWLKSGELNDNICITDNSEFITKKGLEESSAKLFPKGTLLLAMYGATAGKLGILGMDATTNQAVCSIQNKQGLFDEKYLYNFLLLKREEIIRDSFGGAQPNISKTYIDNIKVPLPPLPEQHRIVSKLDVLFAEIDASLALIDQNIAQAETLKLSLLDEEIHNEAFETVPYLKYIIERKERLKPEPETVYNIIGLENIESYSGRLINFKPLRGEERISNKSVFKEGDVLYSKLRPYLNKVIIAEFDGIATTEILPFIPDSEMFLNTFVAYFLRSESIVQKINISCSGARMPRVRASFWKTLEIPMPSLESQQKIVQKLDALFAEIDALVLDYTKKRENLEALKSSLLDKAFKGEL